MGLKDFQRRVLRARRVQPREMARGLNDVGQVLVENIIPLIEDQLVSDPSRLDHKLEDSVRAQSTSKDGMVIEGYANRTPYAGWWEFGGSTKRKAGGVDRKFIKRGRAMYPALEKSHEMMTKVLEDVLNRLARIANGD